MAYPFIPIVFILVAIVLLINTLWSMPIESGLGFIYLLSGLPIFMWLIRNKPRVD